MCIEYSICRFHRLTYKNICIEVTEGENLIPYVALGIVKNHTKTLRRNRTKLIVEIQLLTDQPVIS